MEKLSDSGAEQDVRRAAAVEIALKVGLLEKCETHGCIFDSMNDFALEDALRYGDSLMANNDPAVAVFEGNRKRLHYAIEHVRTGMPNCCPECFHAKTQATMSY